MGTGQRLRQEVKLKSLLALFFQNQPGLQFPDPDQLKRVSEFKEQLAAEKRHLAKGYEGVNEYC